MGPAADFLQVDPSPFPLIFTGANQNQQLCAPVTIVNDMMFEDDESFYALINDPSNDPGIVLAPNMARITIIDDDPPPEEDPTMGEIMFFPLCCFVIDIIFCLALQNYARVHINLNTAVFKFICIYTCIILSYLHISSGRPLSENVCCGY